MTHVALQVSARARALHAVDIHPALGSSIGTAYLGVHSAPEKLTVVLLRCSTFAAQGRNLRTQAVLRSCCTAQLICTSPTLFFPCLRNYAGDRCRLTVVALTDLWTLVMVTPGVQLSQLWKQLRWHGLPSSGDRWTCARGARAADGDCRRRAAVARRAFSAAARRRSVGVPRWHLTPGEARWRARMAAARRARRKVRPRLPLLHAGSESKRRGVGCERSPGPAWSERRRSLVCSIPPS